MRRAKLQTRSNKNRLAQWICGVEPITVRCQLEQCSRPVECPNKTAAVVGPRLVRLVRGTTGAIEWDDAVTTSIKIVRHRPTASANGGPQDALIRGPFGRCGLYRSVVSDRTKRAHCTGQEIWTGFDSSDGETPVLQWSVRASRMTSPGAMVPALPEQRCARSGLRNLFFNGPSGRHA